MRDTEEMALYRIYRMRESARQQFRWAPHTSGASMLKPRDFEPSGEAEAHSVYDAWQALRTGGDPLQVGDVLEHPGGELRIYKYVGFEEAKWVLPETKPPDPGAADPPVGETIASSTNPH